ncbi:hypothetical protein OSG_eHP14_00240 [environmental Halophage eHP-14]|nr:hypothetical protein OSG_eHP14_00240 [environmental Halophage eHP-14]
MTDTQRRVHTPDPDAVEVREIADDSPSDGLFSIRMPVTSTAEARDGVAFDRTKVEGFRDQIAGERIPVFLDHGRNEQTGHRYSALGKVGYLAEPELAERDAATDLMADFRLVDPDDLNDDVGEVREMLSWLREQAERGLPVASSIGWSDDTGERDLPGDADLLEASIVGIPSDARTTTASAEPARLARAVSAASSEFDVETFVRELERVEVDGEEIDLTPPDAVQNAATVALAKDDELNVDCGTGAGRQSARQIAGDDVSAERIDDIAAYLTSHEEDVSAEGTPSDWSDEEWSDCGNLQYALWGGLGTGTGLEWAQSKANEVAEAQGEELPYPDRARNLDNPEFSEGDAVEWSSNDTTVRGRVADIGDEFSPAEGVTITGDDGEAVYLIHELDDSLEPPQYRRENVAKPESSLNESQADLPPLEGNFADEDNSMTDTDTEPDEESGDEPDEQRADMEEMMAEMVDLQREQTDMIREMHDDQMNENESGEDDEDEDDDMEESSAEADDDERSEDSDETRTVTLDGEERAVNEAIADLREMAEDAETAEPDTRNNIPDDDVDDEDTVGDDRDATSDDINWRS